MSPCIRTLALAAMAFSPFAAAWPKTCPASCVMTVTSTVRETAPCCVLSSASATSAMETSSPTSISSNRHHSHYHHHNFTISWPINSTATAAASSNMIPTSSAAVTSASSAEQTSSSLSSHHRRHHNHTTSLNAAPTTPGAALPTPIPASPLMDCQPDNCLRHFIRHPDVSGFCATYTTELNTATTGLPDLVSQCQSDPTRISSACSCVATGVPTSTPTPPILDCQHDNCLRHFIRHPEATGFCATYTTGLNTATTGLPDLVSQCHNDPTRISSACSCVVTGTSSPTSSPGAQTTATNDGSLTTTTPSGPAQTSSSSESAICTVTTETSIVTISVVTTITLDDPSTSSAISGAMTSEAAPTYFTTTTTTESAAASSSSEMAASPSSEMGHRHRHGHPGGR
jgi:hypothetical protein